MDEELLEKAEAFAQSRGGTIGEPLGFGIHGIVVVLKSEREGAATALKIHSSREPCRRERDCYERLRERGVTKLLGFHVPQLLHSDDAQLALEMTIVPPPFRRAAGKTYRLWQRDPWEPSLHFKKVGEG